MAITYELNDFMYYPNIAFKMAAVPMFSCGGALNKHEQYSQALPKGLIGKAWLIFGVAGLVYQTMGLVIYFIANFYSIVYVDPAHQVDMVVLISDSGSIFCLTLVALCKMSIIYLHGERISKLLKELQEIFPSERMQEDANSTYRVCDFAKSSGNLMKCATVFFIFAFFYYNSLPLLQILYEYFSEDKNILYRYQSNTWYPWQTEENSKSWWNYVAAYLCQMQSSLIGLSFIMASEFLLCFFITQMQMHFDYLCRALLNLDASSAQANTDLKYLIAYHIKLLRFSKEINFIFNISFLVIFMTSTVALCLMGICTMNISTISTMKYSVGLMFFLVVNFLICYNGSKFTESGDELMSSAFHSNWYEGDLSYRRMIYFFMMRSSKSNVLRAYKFNTVSMPTFMMILQLAFKLFTFINAIE